MWPFSKRTQAAKNPSLTDNERKHLEQVRREKNAAQALGRHYVDWVEPIKELKRQGKLEEAEKILLACVDATERESTITNYGVAPWYYEQLAIIYRKQDRPAAEVDILERFMKQKHGQGAKLDGMADRLAKASELWSKQKGTGR